MNLCDEPGKEIRRFGKHRLVEECEEVSIGSVQKAFGKKALIAAIRQDRPIRLSVLGGEFNVWPIDGPHHLPGVHKRSTILDNGLCRLWLICPGCRRKVAKLHYYFFSRDPLTCSDLLCRGCHGLTYQSKNCAGNRWYEQVARPLKRLLSEKRKLMVSHLSPGIERRLAQIEDETRRLRQKLLPKTPRRNKSARRFRSRQRRPYRDLSLFGVVDRGDRVNMQLGRSNPNRGSSLAISKAHSSEMPGPDKTNQQALDEDSQFWLDAISQFRNEGLITDDHVSRFPELRRALEMVSKE